MATAYWIWVGWSIGISAAILLLTLAVLCLILYGNDTIFYGIVAQLLNIERCFIDAHHNIIRKDDKLNLSPQRMQDWIRDNPKLIMGFVSELTGGKADPENASEASSNHPSTNKKTSDDASKNDNNIEKKQSDEVKRISENPKSQSGHQREVLNLYGRYIGTHKRGSLIFVMTLTTIIISGALIAAFNSLFLNTTSVYRDGPCPAIGPMECYCGYNSTYFTCDTGKNNSCPLDVHVAACFRWTGRDLTTSDVTTQLGVTAGLLLAFGNITQAIIRIYLLAFSKRLSIATGIHRIAAKAIGINRHTSHTKCCCCKLPWHCSPCNLSLFKNPAAVIIVTIIYIAIPILMIPGVAMLYYYELSVTALTFIVLIVFAMVCIISIVWIMVQDTEASSNIPGGWNDIKQLAQVISWELYKYRSSSRTS